MLIEPGIRQTTGDAERVALVTGASGEIGAAVSMALAESGFAVALHCFTHSEPAERLCRSLKALGTRAAVFSADLASPKAAVSLVRDVGVAFGEPSCLVHAATPPLARAPLLMVPDEELDQHLLVHAAGFVRLCKAAIPAMQLRQSGAIVPILSTVLERERPKQWSAYTLAKFALAGGTAAVATDVEGTGVRVVALMPSAVDTALSRRAGVQAAAWLTPDVVAALVVRIVNEPALFHNGAIVRVNAEGSEVGGFDFVGRPVLSEAKRDA